MNAAFKESLALYDELGTKNADWKKIYADYSSFRTEQNLWFRFTEATFDRFMQRSEEHTSELQSRLHLVCRLLLEKKKIINNINTCSVLIISNHVNAIQQEEMWVI